jgi:hypothetical protein
MLKIVDENRKMNDLPRFVTDKTSLVPSQRLFEGDLHFLFSNMKRIEGKMDDMFGFMSKLYTLYTSRSSVPDDLSHLSTTGQSDHPPGFVQACASYSQALVGQSTVTSVPGSTQLTGVHSSSTSRVFTNKNKSVGACPLEPSWSAQVESAQGDAGSSFTLTDIDKDNDDFTVVRNKHSSRRYRSNLSANVNVNNTLVKKRLLDNEHGVCNVVSPRFGNSNSNQRPSTNRKGPLVVGKRVSQSHSTSGPTLMGRKRKRYFYLDNINPNYTADDVICFLRTENINVVSCIAVRPRKRWQGQDISDRAAFRLCIFDDDEEHFLDPYLLPRGITVYPWIFKVRQDHNIVSAATPAATIDVGVSGDPGTHQAKRQQSDINISTNAVVTSLVDATITQVHGENTHRVSNQSFHDAHSSPLPDESSHHNLSVGNSCLEDCGSSSYMESTLLYDPSSHCNDGDQSE